MTLNTHNR